MHFLQLRAAAERAREAEAAAQASARAAQDEEARLRAKAEEERRRCGVRAVTERWCGRVSRAGQPLGDCARAPGSRRVLSLREQRVALQSEAAAATAEAERARRDASDARAQREEEERLRRAQGDEAGARAARWQEEEHAARERVAALMARRMRAACREILPSSLGDAPVSVRAAARGWCSVHRPAPTRAWQALGWARGC